MSKPIVYSVILAELLSGNLPENHFQNFRNALWEN